MDTSASQSIIPLGAIDRMVGTYVGGSNTGSYYENTYGTTEAPQQQGTIPVETITITPAPIPVQNAPLTNPQTNGQVTGQQASTIDTAQLTQTQEAKTTVDLSVPSVATTVVNGIFSFAVTASIIAGIFIAYVIIRTKQLHHHEEHIRGVLGGHGHDDHGHAPDVAHGHSDTTSHDAHAVAHVEHAPLSHTIRDEDIPLPEEPELQKVISEKSGVLDDDEHADVAGDPLAIRHNAIRLYVASDDVHDWRYALMDMDLLLDDALLKNGYPGDDTEDKLSRTHVDEFKSINTALQAHKEYLRLVSNEDLITQDSMQKLYSLYSPAFSELGI